MSDDFIDSTTPENVAEQEFVRDSVNISPYTLLALTMLKHNLTEVNIDLADIDKFVKGKLSNKLPVVIVQDQGANIKLLVMPLDDAFNYKRMVELDTAKIKAN